MKRHKYQLAALMMSVIMATGSLSGSVFAAETSGDTTESSVVEEIEETDKSETADERASEGSENESEQEAEELSEDTSQKTEGSVEDTQDLDEKEEDHDQSVPEEIEGGTEKEKVESSVNTIDTPAEEDHSVITIPAEQENTATNEDFEEEFESTNLESDQNETIPEETVEIYVGGRLSSVGYEYEENEAVNFEIDESLPIDFYGVRHDIYGYTTNYASCLFLPYGKGSGFIKVIDDQSGKVLKIFKIVINIYEEEITLCKGSYTWTTIWSAPHSYFNWENSDGVEINPRGTNDMAEPDDYLGTYYLYDCIYAVKGKQVGDYLITFYSGDSDIEYHKITYHVVDHDYQVSSFLKEGTCTEDGLVEKECSNCHDKITETIPATGHTWNKDYTVDKEATCTEEGSESIHCSVCGKIDEETVRSIPKKEHAYGDWTVIKEATCTGEGSKEKVCADCNDKVTEAIAATGHTWNDSYTIDKEATCTEEGSESIHCSVCDEIKEGSPRSIYKLDHAYGDWEMVTEPSCTKEGSRKKVCAECGDTVTETVPAAGHTWDESYTVDTPATCKLEGAESIHCSICGEKQDGSERIIPRSSDHRYGEWHIIKEIAGSQDGIKERVCEICGNIEQETISSPYGNVDLKDAVEIREGTTPVAFLTSLENDDTWDQSRWYKFTPDKTATYIFTLTNALYLQSDNDTYLQLFGSYKDAENDTDYIYEDIEGHHDRVVLDSKLNAGQTYYLYLFISADYEWDTEYNMNLTISKKTTSDISAATVTGISNKAYTGSALTQNPTVKVGDKTLTKGTDYLVTYSNNTNAGTATVTITGKGNYSGKKTLTFKINKANQSITAKASSSSIAVGKTAAVSITGSKGTKSYKSSNTAVATVNAAGTVTAKKVGTATITATSAATTNYNAASKAVTIKVVPAATSSITAANQATGIKLTWKSVAGATGYKVYRGAALIKTIKGSTITCTDTKANANGTKYTFKIVPTAPTGDGLAKTLTTYRVARPAVSSVKNTAAKKMTVRWKKNAKANGYQIQYSTNKKFAKGNKTANVTKAATVSRVIGSLTKGKTYYVRIRTYKTVGKAKFWSAWSTAKSVKISK